MSFVHPNLPFAILLVAAYASLFHLWAGRTLRELLLYLVAAGLGFALGHWIGQALELDLLRLGTLHVLEASVAAFLALLLAYSMQRG